ncbi:MAG: hypothetical protein HC845_07730, partial [Akkermansiaceae bacterium]|nr:hypothetical protein [Akkermansiaceae bacterium]
MHHLFQNALEKRAKLLDSSTNAVRLIDGAGDGLPGFFWKPSRVAGWSQPR